MFIRCFKVFLLFAWVLAGLFWSASAYGQYATLNTWYSESRKEHFTTSNPAWSGKIGDRRSPDYRLIRVEGSLLSPEYPQPADTVPVYSFWSDDRKDNILSSDPAWTGSQNRDGYRRFRLEGYLYKNPAAGTVPLISLWSAMRTDNYSTTDTRLALAAGTSAGNRTQTITGGGYQVFRVEGYMLPPPMETDMSQPDYIANLKAIGFGDWRPLRPNERGSRPQNVKQRAAARFKSQMVIVPVEFSDARFGPGDFARYAKFASATDDLSLERGVSAVSRGKFSWRSKLIPVVRDTLTMAQATREVFDEAWKAVEGRTEELDGRQVTWSAELFEQRNGFPLSVYDLDGDGPEFEEVHARTRVLKLADKFIRFNTYDANGDGRVDNSELIVLRFGADPGVGGQASSSSEYSGDGKTVAVSVLNVAKDTTRAGLIHEMLHIWGGTDVYGPDYELNFRNTIMSAMAGDDTVWELDPWHLQKFGWIQPRFVPIGVRSQQAGNSELILAAGHDRTGSQAARPIIFYDPERGLREYFIAQYRSKFPQCPGSSLPDLACPDYQDNGAPDTGFAIWHVRTKESGGLAEITKGDDRGNRVAWPDGTDDRGHLFYLGVIDPADGKIGGTNYLSSSNDTIFPRWWDGADTGLRLRAGLVSASSPVAVLEWSYASSAFTPRLDILRLAGFPNEEYPVVNAGQTIAVEGIFGAVRAEARARLIGEAGRELHVPVISWSPRRMILRIPARARPGRYKILVMHKPARIGSSYSFSNGLNFEIPVAPIVEAGLPRDFDKNLSVPGLRADMISRVDPGAVSLPQSLRFSGRPIAPHPYGATQKKSKTQFIKPGVAAVFSQTRPIAALPVTGRNNICVAATQGRIAWNYQGNKNWGKFNIDRLCKGAETSREPALCFQRIMHERKDGKRWTWSDAIDLCEGTQNANATIRCYDQQIKKSRKAKQAIRACGE